VIDFDSNFRAVGWIFAFYRGIELSAVYKMEPDALEPHFGKWEAKLADDGKADINNPKIPAKFVCDHGTLVFGVRPQQGMPGKK
jgi:type II restriction enzyme